MWKEFKEETVKTLSRQYFPLEIQQALLRWQGELEQVQEIRCRLGRPLRLRLQSGGGRTVLGKIFATARRRKKQHIVQRAVSQNLL